MAKNRDTFADLHPEAKQVEALTTPAAPSPPISLEEALRVLAVHQINLSAALAGVVGDREKFLKLERDDIAKLERLRKQAEKSAQVRTQEKSDSLWPTADNRFRVALLCVKKTTDEATGKRKNLVVPDPAFPVIEINAGSAEEADGRYRKLCGILSTDGQIRATPVGEPMTPRAETHDEYLPEGVMASA